MSPWFHETLFTGFAWATGTTRPTQCDASTDDAVKAGLWKANYVILCDGRSEFNLSTQGDDDEAGDDWYPQAVPEFGQAALPVIGVMALFIVLRQRKKRRKRRS